MNENYAQPSMPAGARGGHPARHVPRARGGEGRAKVRLLGAGTILREVLAAAELLERDWDVAADV